MLTELIYRTGSEYVSLCLLEITLPMEWDVLVFCVCVCTTHMTIYHQWCHDACEKVPFFHVSTLWTVNTNSFKSCRRIMGVGAFNAYACGCSFLMLSVWMGPRKGSQVSDESLEGDFLEAASCGCQGGYGRCYGTQVNWDPCQQKAQWISLRGWTSIQQNSSAVHWGNTWREFTGSLSWELLRVNGQQSRLSCGITK